MDLDLFRVGSFATMLLGTERFRAAVHRLTLDGITCRKLSTRENVGPADAFRSGVRPSAHRTGQSAGPGSRSVTQRTRSWYIFQRSAPCPLELHFLAPER